MANEIRVPYSDGGAGSTLYCLILNSTATQVWYPTGQTFEAWGTGSRTAADYAISISRPNSKGGFYVGDMDTNVSAGQYLIFQAFRQSGGSPADDDYAVWYKDEVYWDGTNLYWYPQQTYGPGSYENTVTIRTTGGTPLQGVQVWLNTTDDRTGSVTPSSYTNGSGAATFYLQDDVTYYVFCYRDGYSFSSANFTPSSGDRTETLDIASAVSSSSTTAYDDSFLSRAVDEVRAALDEPSLDAKYSDSEIITKLEQAYVLVLGEKNRNAKFPIVATYEVTLDGTSTEYTLPSRIGSIYSIYESWGNSIRLHYRTRGPESALGRGLHVEGNTLLLNQADAFATGTVLSIEYIVDGTAHLHNGTCSVNAAGTVVTLGASPNAGSLDTTLNAYAGCVLRIFNVTGSGATGNYVQEQVISSYDRTTREATLRNALSPVPSAGSGGYIYYEIAPAVHRGLDSVIPLAAARMIATQEGNVKRSRLLAESYRDQLRYVRLDAFYSNLQEATRMYADGPRARRGRRL